MPEAPRYPADDTGEEYLASYEPGSPQRPPRSTYVLWATGIVLLTALIVLHLTGVLGPGGH